MKTYSPRRGRLKGATDTEDTKKEDDVKKENKLTSKQQATNRNRRGRFKKNAKDEHVDVPSAMKNTSPEEKVKYNRKTRNQLLDEKKIEKEFEEDVNEVGKQSDEVDESESDTSNQVQVQTRGKKRMGKEDNEATLPQRRRSRRSAPEPGLVKNNAISSRKLKKIFNYTSALTSDSENEIPDKLKGSETSRRTRSSRNRHHPLHVLLSSNKPGKIPVPCILYR